MPITTPRLPDKLLGHALPEIATNLGISHLVLTSGFQSYAASHAGYLYFSQDGHWNESGHNLAAQLTADFLTEKGLIPPSPR